MNNKLIFNLIVMVLFLTQMSLAQAEDKRIKIGVLDTGVSQSIAYGENNILCEGGRRSVIERDTGLDNHGHGTNVISLIAAEMNIKTHCIVSYKVWTKDMTDSEAIQATVKGLKMAVNDGLSYLNVSMSGPTSHDEEFRLYQQLMGQGVSIAVAAGNDNVLKTQDNLDVKCDVFPACYKVNLKNNKFTVVGSYDYLEGNRGKIVTIYERGLNVSCPRLRGVTMRGYDIMCPTSSGTSQSTAIFTGKSIKK